MRLVKIDRDRILYSAFTTDQDLAHTAAYLQNHNIRLWKRKRERYSRLWLKGKKHAASEGRDS
jgi:hypothetical protein